MAKKTKSNLNSPEVKNRQPPIPAGGAKDQFGKTAKDYSGITSEISRPQGTPKGTGTELIGKSEAEKRQISEANAREGRARNLRQMAAEANLLQAKLQMEDAKAFAESPEGQAKQALVEKIAPAGSQQPDTTQNPPIPTNTIQMGVQGQQDRQTQAQTAPQEQGFVNKLIFGQKTLTSPTGEQVPLVAQEFPLSLGGASTIGYLSKLTKAIKESKTATKVFSLATILTLIGKVASNKRQDVKVAAANFKASKKNMGDIINAKNAGLISDEQALEYWNREVANIAAQETALRQMTKTWIGRELSNGLDELAAIEGFNDDYEIYLKPKFQRAILTPDPNAAAVNFETPEEVGQ